MSSKNHFKIAEALGKEINKELYLTVLWEMKENLLGWKKDGEEEISIDKMLAAIQESIDKTEAN